MIGSFGDIIFEISDKKVVSLNNEISRSYKSKVSEHNPIYGPGMLRHQGRELIEVSFSISLNSTLTPELEEEKKKIIEMWEKGEYGNLVFGGQVFGEFPFLILEISETNSYFNKEKGIFDVVELSLTLKEYIENPKLYNQQLEAKKAKKQEVATEESADVEAEQKGAVKK